MIDTLQAIIEGALARLSQQLRTDLPPLIAAAIILLLAYVAARTARWLLTRAFKGIRVDRWLRHSGVSDIIDRSGTLRTSRVVAQTAYWAILVVGLLGALNAFETRFASRMAENIMLLLPRLLIGVLIIVSGLWVARYFGRSTLVWAVNEDLPSPRKLALAVRAIVAFAAIAIAADTVGFAGGVFLAAFVVVLGGVVLAGALAFGLGARDAVRRYFESRAPRAQDEQGERSLWNHL